MNKYLNLLKQNANLREVYRSLWKIKNPSFSSINFLNDISREKKLYYMSWCQRLEQLKKNNNNKNTSEFVKFMDISAKLEMDHTRQEANKILNEFLEKNELDVFSDNDIASMVEFLPSLHVSSQTFNLFKNNFIKRKIDTTDQYFNIFNTIFSKEISRYEIDDLAENVMEFYEINMKKLNIEDFIELLEIYYFLYKPEFSRLLRPTIEYIQKALYNKDMQIDNKSIVQICSAYPRLLNLFGDDDLLRNEMMKMQHMLEEIKFEMTESIVLILNNVSIYGKGTLITQILDKNLQIIYKYLTSIDNANYFPLFLVLTSYKFENQALVKKILRDLIILVQYINPEVFDDKRDLFFPPYKRLCLSKLQELKEILEKRKSDKDIKYSLTFLNTLTKAADLNPISFADFPISALLHCYENMINYLE